MDSGTSRTSREPSTTSARRNLGANRSRASTDESEASMSRPVDNNLAYLLVKEAKAEEGPISRAPEDLYY